MDCLCLRLAFPRGSPHAELLFSGEAPELLDLLPELGYVRDLVFFSKAMMLPAADALPALRRWSVSDASLNWR